MKVFKGVSQVFQKCSDRILVKLRPGFGSPTAKSILDYGVKRRLQPLGKSKWSGEKVLDIGCGFGCYAQFALNCGAKCAVGVDVNHDFLRRGQLIDKVQATMYSLPFKDSYFDRLLLFEVLEHASKEKLALREIKRVLRNHSLLLISVPNKLYPFETHGLKAGGTEIGNFLGIGIPALSWLPQFVRRKLERARIYTPTQIANLLQSEGFAVARVDFMMPPLDQMKNQKLADVLRKILTAFERTSLKYLGCHIIIVATKQGK